VGEYTLIEQLRGMAAIAETFEGLHPQLEDADLRVQVPSLDVSVLVVEGRYEAAGRAGDAGPGVVRTPVHPQQEARRPGELGPSQFSTNRSAQIYPELRLSGGA
jgi:hypothetical protein